MVASAVQVQRPVFLHSLFRSGSTYLFSVFRRSSTGYYCYEEPLSELFLTMDPRLFESMPFTREIGRSMRHPDLDRPYKHEYRPIREHVARCFRKAFPFDLYFLGEQDDEPDLQQYIALLLASATGRPLLQFCRSSFRTAWLHAHFDAVNLYLWRNPRDQWTSYGVSAYFSLTTLLTLGLPRRPKLMEDLADGAGIVPYHAPDIRDELRYYGSVAERLRPELGYFAFYAIWALAYLQNIGRADATIAIDQLSASSDYRRSLGERLAGLGITGLDFNDCRIPRRAFSPEDLQFFRSIEAATRTFLATCDVPERELATLPDPDRPWPRGADDRDHADERGEVSRSLDAPT